jgi:hypothetical protein
MKKYALVVALLILVAIALFMQPRQEAPKYRNYPWDITVFPDGSSAVFGLRLGVTTMEMTMQQLGDYAELALFSTDAQDASVELYYSSFTAGRLSGRLIIVADLGQQQLQQLRESAVRSGGANRFRLSYDDLPEVMRTPVKAVTFIPVVDLDDEIIRRQFGEPSEIIKAEKNLQHFLYPSLGLDVILDAEGKEVLQYVAPKRFSELRSPLQQYSIKAH